MGRPALARRHGSCHPWSRAGPTLQRDSDLDNLTHALVGAAIAKAGAERATPLALGTLVVAANAPDIDILAFTAGEAFALSFRRGLTHGWPALAVLPFVVTGCMLAWDRWVRRRARPELPPARFAAILLLSVVGLATHPTLDWLNIYGMRWSLPFDGSWSYGDALFIIDPWIWLVLGGGLAAVSSPTRRGWVGWSLLVMATTALMLLGVGGPPAVVWMMAVGVIIGLRLHFGPLVRGRRRAMAAVCVAVAGYIVAMLASDRAAGSLVMAEASARGLDATDVLVAPVRGNPLRGEVEVQTPDGYVPGTFRWTGRPRVTLRPEALVPLRDVGDLDEAMAERILEVATRRPPLSHYLVWARYPYVRVSPMEDGWLVHVGDVRYDDEPAAGELGGMSALVTPSEVP